jgi:hypothetical protein
LGGGVERKMGRYFDESKESSIHQTFAEFLKNNPIQDICR